jgi:hypothetical protein
MSSLRKSNRSVQEQNRGSNTNDARCDAVCVAARSGAELRGKTRPIQKLTENVRASSVWSL